MKLNAAQRQAVTHDEGPLLIVAGAGTGKTTVIVERIKYLIQTHSLDPQSIFATTFTHKATEELLGRLSEVMPYGYHEPWIGTFHQLSERLLRENGLEIGLNPNFTLLNQTDQWLLLKDHLFDLPLNHYRPLGNPTKFIQALLTFFSRLQDELITSAELTAYARQLSTSPDPENLAEAARLEELAACFDAYTTLKHESAVLDFGDLISLSLELLRKRPSLRSVYQSRFSHILVDEFQDTNYAQYQLIKTLAPPENHPNLIVVGDDDQSVYKFRGASIANILQFKSDYPLSREVVLTHNYRSTQNILNAAYASIVHNNPERLEPKLNLSKKLLSQSKTITSPEIHQFATLPAEINWTITQIATLVATHGLKYSDIAILTRANSQLNPYVEALKAHGIPYQLIANRGLYDQPEVKSLVDFLRVLIDPADNLSLFNLSQSTNFNLPPALIFSLLREARHTGNSLWQLIQSTASPALDSLRSVINQYQPLAATTSTSVLLYRYLEEADILTSYLTPETIENQLKLKNIQLFFERLQHFEAHSSDHNVLQFLDAFDAWLEAGENPGQAQIEDIDTVMLLTIHAAKGLEFPAVFIGSLVAGRFPSSNRKDLILLPDALVKENLPSGDFHLQEERRLFYVALTRAKEHLYLTHALNYGSTRQWRPSGFLSELNLPTVDHPAIATPHPLPPQVTTSPHHQFLDSQVYEIKSLSYSQIDTFKACPLKYKYRYLLKVPAKPHHSLAFGRSIHATLHQFHLHQMQGRDLSLSELHDLFKDNFLEEGYDSPTHKELRFQAGLDALTKYYHQHQSLFGTPKFLEQKFSLQFDDIHFTGIIDRIDIHPDSTYELIDYKTGTAKDQTSVNRDKQLSIYALAAQKSLHLNLDKLSLYFVEDSQAKVSTTRNQKQLDRTEKQLAKDINSIKTSSFPPKPNPVTCSYCEYRNICPFAAKS